MHYPILVCFLALAWCSSIHQLQARDFEPIQGIIVDRATNRPLPFVNIYTTDLKRGTISNTDGRYILKIDDENAILIFSCIGYKTQSVSAGKLKMPSVIIMEGISTKLKEITVTEKNKSNYALEMILKARQKILGSKNNIQWGKVMYRQKSRIDKDYTEFYEKFYDINYSLDGIKQMEMTQGRYAIRNNFNRSKFLYHYNYSDLSKKFSITGDNGNFFITPFQSGQVKYFNLKVVSTSMLYGREVVEIEFTSKVNKPALEGSVFIDLQCFDLLKLNARVAHKDLKMASLEKNYGDKIHHFSITYSISFRPDTDSTLVLNQLEIDINYNHLKKNQFNSRVNTNILLFLYDNELNNRFDFTDTQTDTERLSDLQKIKKSTYDPQFWLDNPIVKRTGLEEDLIKSFENTGAFGNMDGLVNLEMEAELETNEAVGTLNSLLLANTAFNEIYTQEKIYVHTNKQTYFNGDTIAFKAYILEAQQLVPDPSSGVVYIELINEEGSRVNNVLVKNTNGLASGYIEIPTNAMPGQYRLRAYTNWMLNFGADRVFTRNLNVVNKAIPLNWDVRFDTLKSKQLRVRLSLKNADNYPLDNHEVVGLFVAAKGAQFVDTLATNEEGVVIFQLKTEDVDTTDLLFQFETRYNSQLLNQKYHLVTNPKIEIEFFPEGGTLVEGFSQLVACKVSQNGKTPNSISGLIVDETNQLLTSVKIDSTGLGYFSMVPHAGKNYKLKRFDNYYGEVEYALPEVQNSGIYFHVDNHCSNDSIIVQIAAINRNIDEPYFLIGTVRSKVVYAVSFSLNEGINKLSISKKNRPEGILQLDLFDNDKNLLAKRLTAIQQHNELKMLAQISSDDDSTYISLQSFDDEDDLVQTSFSLSVLPFENSSGISDEDIYQNLLYTDELKHSSTCINGSLLLPENFSLLERMCLTQPMGTNNWDEAVNKTLPPPKYEVEKNLKLRGKIVEIPKRVRPEELHLSAFVNKDYPYIQTVQPATDSTFVFDICDFTGSSKAVLSAIGKKRKNINFDYEILENKPQLPSDNYKWLFPNSSISKNINYQVLKNFQPFNIGENDSFANRYIDEITIVENTREKIYDQFADRVIDVEKMNTREKEIYLDLFDLIYQNYPAARYEYDFETGNVLKLKANQTSGSGGIRRILAEPLYYVNDRIYDPFYDRSILRTIDINTIRSIRIAGPGNGIISSVMFTGPVEMLRGGVISEIENTSDTIIIDNIRTYLSHVVITTFTNDYLIAKMKGVNSSIIKGFCSLKSDLARGIYFSDGSYWNPGQGFDAESKFALPVKNYKQIIKICGVSNDGTIGGYEQIIPVGP